MKKLSVVFTVLSLALVLFTSCKHEGCTDVDSVNFDPKANVNDGSCEYEGSVVFWYNQATADSLQDYDAQSLTISVDNQVIGSYATNVYFAEAPTCKTSSVVTTTEDLGGAKSKSYSYTVTDQDDFVWWSGNINVDANTCTGIELQWSNSKSKLVKK